MASNRKFYKSVFKVVVLSEEPIDPDTSLYSVSRNIIEGEWSGDFSSESNQVVDGPTMAKLLLAQGSDPEFFRLDESGNDVSYDDLR